VATLAEELLDRSLVCGWFEGRSEVGPRALGKRAIVGRPDSVAVRDRVNLLKGRESWRPLAPSLSAAEFDRSFAGSTPSAHMLIAASAAPGVDSRLAGVIHVDDTSRPQVVRHAGPYRRLLAEMGRAADVEAVICTSFNRAGQPLVYSPEDALSAARAMGLDLLAGDGWCARLTAS
jgi:carbamoyltransferase